MTHRRRLLAVADIPVWPVLEGFSVRATGLLRELSRSWDLTLIAPAGSSGGEPPFPIDRRRIVEDKESKRRALQEELQSHPPDAILWWMGLDTTQLPERWYARTVVDQVDSQTLTCWREARHIGSLRKKLSWWRSTLSFARYERWLMRSVAAVVVVGEKDAQTMARLAGGRSPHVVPNGVDVLEDPMRAEHDRPTVVFTGVMEYPPNVDAVCSFAAGVWPRVRERIPDARFVIGGRRPNAEVLALAEKPGIEVVADLPDMKAFLNQAWVAVAPMRQGAGIKNKVLEAWSVGVPTVLTSIATNGLALEPGGSAWVVDGEERWVDTLVDLLCDDAKRRALGERMRDRAREQHGWGQAASGLVELLDRTALSQSAGGAV